MSEDRKPGIAPPPSVDDVLSALADDGRIGQVEFAAVPPEAEPAPTKERRPRKAPEPVVEVAPEPEPEPAPEPPPVTVLPPVGRERVVDVARAVEEVAAEVIGRMRDAEQATLRHLEAMELEATRRYELVTAQAELDAELIRLQSRREAHAIVTAARTRAGELDDLDDDPDDEGHRLSAFSDAVSRIADATDASLNRGRGNGA
jgi:hypothetical protein